MVQGDSYLFEGRLRLHDLLPWAREQAARKISEGLVLTSNLAKTLGPYIREDNLEALVVRPGPRGGWHADILFKSVPPGIPDSLGSPVQTPLRTREDAMEYAKGLLLDILVAAKRPATKPELQAVFELLDWEVPLVPVILQTMTAISGGEARYPSKEFAAARIGEAIAQLFPDGFSPERYRALSSDGQATFQSVLHMAALTGVFRYPALVDQPPPPDGPSGCS